MRYKSLALTLCQFLIGYAAHTQVHVTYTTTYLNPDDSTNLPPHGARMLYMDYWIGFGQYAYVTDSGPGWLTVYSSEDNIMRIMDYEGKVTEQDASTTPYKLLEYEVSDSIFNYRGYQAYKVRGKNEVSSFEAIYSVKQFFDPAPFADHRYANWNEELGYNKGGLLLKGTRHMDGETSVMEFVHIESLELDKEDFNPERFRKYWEGKTDQLIQEIREKQNRLPLPLEFTNVQMSGKLTQNGITFPFELTSMDPSFMKLKMDVMNTSVLIYHNKEHITTYNPFAQTAIRARRDGAENSSDNLFKKVFRKEIVPDGVHVSYVNDLDIDSLRLRRVVLHSGDMYEVRFYDLESGLMKLSIAPGAVEWYLDYKKFGVHLFPENIISLTEGLAFKVADLSVDLPIDESYFGLPDSLKHLIQDETAELSASEYFDLAERQASHVNDTDSLDAAIVNYKKAIKKSPESDLYHNQLGNAYYFKEDYFSALVNYKLATEKNPLNYIVWQNLASVKYQLENYESALEDINQAIELNGLDSDNFDWRAEIYYSLDQPEKAKSDLLKAFSLAPESKELASKLGILYYGMDEYDSGLYFMDKAAALGSLDGDEMNYHGLLYFSVDNYDKALNIFEEVIREYPSVTIATYNRAYTLASMGRREEAIVAYEEMLKNDTTNAEVMDNVGLLHYENEDYAAAIPYFRQAIAVNENEAIYYDHLGNSYYHQMKFTDAISAYDKSINLYPDDPQIYYNRGMAKVRLNDKFDGCKDLQRAKELGMEDAGTQFAETCSFLPEN